MGQDAIVAGGNFNAKMTYSSGGIQSAKELNQIGSSLNLMNGTDGLNISRGKDGGIEVNGDPFPWDKMSFGFQIGVIEQDPSHAKRQIMNYKKVIIGDGLLHYGYGYTTRYSVPASDPIEITATTSQVQVIFLEIEFELTKLDLSSEFTQELWTVAPSKFEIKSEIFSSVDQPFVEFEVDSNKNVTKAKILLFAFGLYNDNVKLFQIMNVGDIWLPVLNMIPVVVHTRWSEDDHMLIEQRSWIYGNNITFSDLAEVATAEECPDGY